MPSIWKRAGIKTNAAAREAVRLNETVQVSPESKLLIRSETRTNGTKTKIVVKVENKTGNATSLAPSVAAKLRLPGCNLRLRDIAYITTMPLSTTMPIARLRPVRDRRSRGIPKR